MTRSAVSDGIGPAADFGAASLVQWPTSATKPTSTQQRYSAQKFQALVIIQAIQAWRALAGRL